MPTIDEDFKTLLRPLSNEERMALEKSILDLGQILCKGVTWNGVIVDGHHRWEISQKYGIPMEFEEKQFESREEAASWIGAMQSARRNMDREEMKQIRKKIAEMMTSGMTMRQMAAKLSMPLVKTARQAARVEAIEALSPEVREVAEEAEKVPTDHLRKIRKLSSEDQAKALQALRDNPKKLQRMEDVLGLNKFDRQSWNERIEELCDQVKKLFYDKRLPTCEYMTQTVKTNIVSYAEALVASLESARVVDCPRCLRCKKDECKCCGGTGLVCLEVSKMFGGRE